MQRHLNVHGDNIGNVVQYMEREHKARFQVILDRIATKIPGVTSIDTKVTDDKRVLLRFNDGAFADPFYASQMSDGTLKIFAYLLLMEDPEPPPFICIEEPENGLYHRLLEALANELRSHATGKKGAPQVVVTTHQPYFVDALSPKEVWILEKGEDGFSAIRRASDIELVRNLVEEGLPLGALVQRLPGREVSMHIEVLVEDGSGARLVETLLPQIIGEQGQPHTWRIHDFKGIGRIPKGLGKKGDPVKMTLLDRLPGILRAHGKTHGIDAVVVVLDSDTRDCRQFLGELDAILQQCDPAPRTLFRLAIEEMEAWYLGDRQALIAAYPKAKRMCWPATGKTAFAAPGNCWPTQSIRAATPPSNMPAGRCRGRSSMSGPGT